MHYIINGKIVFIPVEVKNREWKAKILLAHYFLKKGYHVIIGVLWYMDDYACKSISSNCVYIGKDFYKYQLERYKQIKNQNHFITAWDEEGLIYDTDENYIALQVNKDTLNILDYIITWGQRQKETLLKYYNTNKIDALGNPRIDLLNKKIINNFYSFENNYILKKYGKDYILINSNFNIMTRKDYDNRHAVFSANGKSDISEKFLDYYDSFLSELFPKFISMIKIVAKNNPDKKIILRPHPAEEENPWKEILKGIENIYIDKSFSVYPWINNAKVIIHSGCTTGFEATLLGKNVISYQPKLSINYPDTFPDKISKIIKSEDEINEEIKNIYENFLNQNLTTDQKKLINYYFSIESEKSCSERIVERIDELYDGNGFIEFFITHKRISKKQNDINIEFGHITKKEIKNDFKCIYKSIKGNYRYKIIELEDNEFIILNKNKSENIHIDLKKSFKNYYYLIKEWKLFKIINRLLHLCKKIIKFIFIKNKTVDKDN